MHHLTQRKTIQHSLYGVEGVSRIFYYVRIATMRIYSLLLASAITATMAQEGALEIVEPRAMVSSRATIVFSEMLRMNHLEHTEIA
jgi:hypothetical protein